MVPSGTRAASSASWWTRALLALGDDLEEQFGSPSVELDVTHGRLFVDNLTDNFLSQNRRRASRQDDPYRSRTCVQTVDRAID
jgi:hypothetical protein